ncbi:MAG: HAD hydrolase-like protein [Actinomycetota bacterium]
MLFDLDGTITDPSAGITASIRRALDGLGLDVPADADLRRCIGPPLQEAFAALGVEPELIVEAIARYRAHYDAGALLDLELHDGMAEVIGRLVDHGRVVGVATSKPWPYAERILDALDLRDRLDVVAGAELDGTNRSKADVVADAVSRLGDPDPDTVVLVGDRHHDVEGAAAHGIDTIGVTWGFADDGELEAAGADRIVSSASELTEALGASGPPPQLPLRRAARAVVVDRDDRILLVHWLRPGIDVWITPGGGVEPGEVTVESLRRELVEEVGLDGATVGPVLLTRAFRTASSDAWHGQREAWRLVRVDRHDPPPVDQLPAAVEEGIVEIRWWSIDELRAAPPGTVQHDAVEAIAAAVAIDPPPRPVHLSGTI